SKQAPIRGGWWSWRSRSREGLRPSARKTGRFVLKTPRFSHAHSALLKRIVDDRRDQPIRHLDGMVVARGVYRHRDNQLHLLDKAQRLAGRVGPVDRVIDAEISLPLADRRRELQRHHRLFGA